MPIIIGIAVICVFGWLVGGIIDITSSILTLDFLPKGVNMLADSKMSTYSIPIIGFLINYLVWVFVNILDFIIWCVHWIPGVDFYIDVIYACPDIDLPNTSWGIFKASHRNFITHSVLNPIFIIAIILCGLISFILPPVGIILIMLTCLTFSGHLLADTMPNAWVGTSFIQVKLWGAGFHLGEWFSQIWLYINALMPIIVGVSASEK